MMDSQRLDAQSLSNIQHALQMERISAELWLSE